MAAEITRVIKGEETKLVSDGEGVAFRNIDKMVAALTAEDVVVSVDVTMFKQSPREKSILPYLKGGLTF